MSLVGCRVWDMPVDEVPGISKRTAETLFKGGVGFVGDLLVRGGAYGSICVHDIGKKREAEIVAALAGIGASVGDLPANALGAVDANRLVMFLLRAVAGWPMGWWPAGNRGCPVCSSNIDSIHVGGCMAAKIIQMCGGEVDVRHAGG